MTRTWAPASSGWISGVGFAMAKTMGSRLIFWMSLSDTTPGPESPMKTSAPARASPAEHRRDGLHDGHDLVDVLGIEADREGVDAREVLEDEGLALHDRLRATGADVAQPQHGGAVGDDGHGIALDGEGVGLLRIVMDGHAHAGHDRRVRHGTIGS